MRVDLLSKEYPPHIYGGAGVHVAELVRALRASIEVHVRCFGEARGEADVTGYPLPGEYARANPALQTLAVDALMAADCAGTDLVHSHTWYANEAGRLAQSLWDVPHVVTAHSLEPLRPWKAEQLAGGYTLSLEIERRAFASANAIIAVSDGMRRDVLRCYPELNPERVHTIHNGIDLDLWQPRTDIELLRRHGINPDAPSIVFVGRITRQKGLPYLLRAAAELRSDVQLILCAGAPDTVELAAEVEALVSELRERRGSVVWIAEQLPQAELAAILSSATAFVCPSIYEPLGIVNLEAMACELPVVGTHTGGIPEVVEHGVTGLLVPIEQRDDGTGTPVDPDQFVADLAAALNEIVADESRAAAWGRAGRLRAGELFSWDRIAERTREVYRSVLG